MTTRVRKNLEITTSPPYSRQGRAIIIFCALITLGLPSMAAVDACQDIADNNEPAIQLYSGSFPSAARGAQSRSQGHAEVQKNGTLSLLGRERSSQPRTQTFNSLRGKKSPDSEHNPKANLPGHSPKGAQQRAAGDTRLTAETRLSVSQIEAMIEQAERDAQQEASRQATLTPSFEESRVPSRSVRTANLQRGNFAAVQASYSRNNPSHGSSVVPAVHTEISAASMPEQRVETGWNFGTSKAASDERLLQEPHSLQAPAPRVQEFPTSPAASTIKGQNATGKNAESTTGIRKAHQKQEQANGSRKFYRSDLSSQSKDSAPRGVNIGQTMKNVSYSTVAILVISVLSILVMKKMGFKSSMNSAAGENRPAVIERTSLNSKCHLHVVQVKHHKIVVGVDQSGIKSMVCLPSSFVEELDGASGQERNL